MRNRPDKFEKYFLRILSGVFLVSLPFLFRKNNIKDSILIFAINGYTNSIADRFLVNRRILKYPVRLLAKDFKFNFVFDVLFYPAFSLFLYRWTKNDNPLKILYKTLLGVSSIFFVELWAEKNTDLIKWQKGWKWYHSFISLNLKSLSSRALIAAIKMKAEKQEQQQEQQEQ